MGGYKDKMLKIKNLTKKYKKIVLDDITVDFPLKKVSVIVGVNGIGKTTLLDCIVGLKKQTSGKVSINGKCNNSEEFKEQVFYLPSDFYLPNFMTGNEYLSFVLSRYSNSKKDMIDEFVELFDLNDSINKLIESYSFGMKKKIQIIAAALSNTPYILGDEIFTGLDFETTLITLELFQKLSNQSSIVIVSHDKLIIEEFSENLLLLSEGKLLPYQGTIKDLERTILDTEKVNEKIKFIKKYSFIS